VIKTQWGYLAASDLTAEIKSPGGGHPSWPKSLTSVDTGLECVCQQCLSVHTHTAENVVVQLAWLVLPHKSGGIGSHCRHGGVCVNMPSHCSSTLLGTEAISQGTLPESSGIECACVFITERLPLGVSLQGRPEGLNRSQLHSSSPSQLTMNVHSVILVNDLMINGT
jgi:hypothetical protein